MRCVIKGGRTRPLLVDAVNDAMVDETARRPKAGFPFPLARWVAEELDMRDVRPEILGLDSTVRRDMFERGRRGVGVPQYWALLVLAVWMRANKIAPA